MAKILIVTWNFPPRIGGIEILVQDIASSLAQRHEVTVLTRENGKVGSEHPEVVRIHASNLFLFIFKAIWSAWTICRNRRIHVLIAGSVPVCAVTVPVGLLRGIPRVVVTHGFDMTYRHPAWRLFLRIMLPLNNDVVVNSRRTRENAIACGLPEKKTTLIHPGISDRCVRGIGIAESREAIRGTLGIADRPALLTVGRLTRRKGIHAFLRECFPRILREVPGCVLLIVGDDPSAALVRSVRKSSELSLIRSAVQEGAFEDSVRLLGPVEDAAELMGIYRAADVFIFPVRDDPHDAEGFGMVAIEAALAGTPTVAFRTGGIPDAVGEHGSGVLVPPDDYEMFAGETVRLLLDPDLRMHVGEAARKRAISDFTWIRLGRLWEELMRKYIPQGKVSR